MKSAPGIALLLLLVSCYSPHVFAQGSLTPPGAPAPTMRSLDQIEPRTPISAVPFTISSSGSYYLTKSLNVASGNAIVILTSNVTLDLNGFTLSSTENPANSSSAILINGGLANIAVLNGAISSNVAFNGTTYSGSGFAYGIFYSGNTAPPSVRVQRISVYRCLAHGIYLGNSGSVVESCAVNTAGNYGILAESVSNSVALNCGSGGILAETASNCTGTATNNGTGLQATTAINCYGLAAGSGIGLSATSASNCYGSNSANGSGLSAAMAANSYGYSSTGTGLITNIAAGCQAYTASPSSLSPGLHAEATASNCYGFSAGSGAGIYSAGTVENSYGQCTGAGTGLYAAANAVNCYGTSIGGFGIYVGDNGFAIFCTGQSGASQPVAINCNAGVAIGCNTQGGNIVAAQKLLGTP